MLAVGIVVAGFGATAAFSESCSLSSLKPVNIGANTFVYAADGSFLGSIPADRNRNPVSLKRMSAWLPAATVSVEDKRFYQHGGIDYVGIARAMWTDLSAGKVVEGGSTITQQLVRNMYTGREQTFDRKIKEACLAIKLSDRWSKPRILQTYLNTVYYGNHAYGVEAASETYFSRHARNLNLAQAALIAGLPQAPSIYDPLVNPKAALIRRKEVLRAMLDRPRDHAQAVPVGGEPEAAPEAEPDLHVDQAAVLLLVRDRRARGRVRRERRARRRPPRLHDDRAEAPGRRELGDPRDARSSPTTPPPRSSR